MDRETIRHIERHVHFHVIYFFINSKIYFRFDLKRPSDRSQQSSSEDNDESREIQTSRLSGASPFNEEEEISPPPVTFKKVIVIRDGAMDDMASILSCKVFKSVMFRRIGSV